MRIGEKYRVGDPKTTIESELSDSNIDHIDIKQVSTTNNNKKGKRRVISNHSMIEMDQ
jgi:hypothetical protein